MEFVTFDIMDWMVQYQVYDFLIDTLLFQFQRCIEYHAKIFLLQIKFKRKRNIPTQMYMELIQNPNISFSISILKASCEYGDEETLGLLLDYYDWTLPTIWYQLLEISSFHNHPLILLLLLSYHKKKVRSNGYSLVSTIIESNLVT
jgi:hypothetical protein